MAWQVDEDPPGPRIFVHLQLWRINGSSREEHHTAIL